jgi:aminobenzoyl-glutamate utilization protein B
LAATVLDLLLQPELISETKRYFSEVQTKDKQYEPFIGPDDKPPLDLNETAMQKFRPLMQPFYYDADKYDTYLEQLGVQYPVRERPT